MLIFNGHDLTDYLVVNNIVRSIMAPQKVVSLDIPNKIGSLFVRKEIQNIILAVEITILGNSRENLLENIRLVAEILNEDEPKTIELYDELNIKYVGMLDGTTDLNVVHGIGNARLTFICESFKYGLLKSTTGTALSNTGDVETADWRTVITFTGTGANVIINVGTNSLIINQAVVATNILAVDFKLRTIKLNGTLIMDKLSLASDFFKLPIGNSTLSVTGATHTKITYYQELYR